MLLCFSFNFCVKIICYNLIFCQLFINSFLFYLIMRSIEALFFAYCCKIYRITKLFCDDVGNCFETLSMFYHCFLSCRSRRSSRSHSRRSTRSKSRAHSKSKSKSKSKSPERSRSRSKSK